MWSLYVIFVAIDARPASPTLLDNTGHPAPDHQTQVNTLSLLVSFDFEINTENSQKSKKKSLQQFLFWFEYKMLKKYSRKTVKKAQTMNI